MEIVRPITVTDAILTSTNITEDDYGVWDVDTTYADVDRVIVIGTTHKVYESVQSGNVGNDPTTDDETWWVEVSATNRWKAFDQKISDRVENTGSIEYTFEEDATYITSVVLFGLSGETANVTVTDLGGADGEVYNETVSLIDNDDVIDWYTFFFEEIRYLTEAQFLDIPPYIDARVEVTVSGGVSDTIQVGQLVMGFPLNIGFTTYGTTIGIEDYSRKEVDDYGNPVIVQRNFSRTADFDVQYLTSTARRVQKFLADYRATPLVYIGSRDPEYGTTIYGFYRRFDLTLQGPSYSLASIEVEGLT